MKSILYQSTSLTISREERQENREGGKRRECMEEKYKKEERLSLTSKAHSTHPLAASTALLP